MKRLLQGIFFTTMLLIMSATSSTAQTRYLDEVFQNVQVDTGIVYGQNYEFFTSFQTLQPLVMDIYRPAGDTATHRPVILLSHNGSFLPENLTAALLGFCFKGTKDSSLVEMCKRFARRGYVAVSFRYRLGWSATSNDQTTRTKTIIQAVYRAMQDAKGLVRYLKNDYANGNTYGIDTGKIVIGGTNSGAYVALAASSLNNVTELNQAKFVDANGPFIKQDTLGDFNGFGGVQNHDNYPGISSRFQCVLALGGAVGDTSWIEAGETPILAFHGTNETLTPYNTNIVVTSTQQPVIEVSGSGDFMPYVDAKGNNNVFKPNNFGQGPPNKNGAGQQTAPIEGLYPFYGQGFEPWNWYECNMSINPTATKPKAMAYIDTIMGYSLPRLYRLFVDQTYGVPTGINEVRSNVDLTIFPNPASSEITLKTKSAIRSVEMQDLSGRLVQLISNIGENQTTLDVSSLSKGLYMINVKMADGATATTKVAVEK